MRDCGWTPLSQKPTLAVKGADISRLLSQWASCYSQFTEKPWHSIFPFSGPHPAKQQENEKMVVEEEEEEKAPGKMKMGGAIWNTSSNECWQVKETDGCRIRSPMCLKHGKSLWPFFYFFFNLTFTCVYLTFTCVTERLLKSIQCLDTFCLKSKQLDALDYRCN